MGKIHAKLSFSNPRERTLKALQVDALVDTGAITLCIPEHVAIQLRLETLEQREVTTADGKRRNVAYVGPIQVGFENRSSFTVWCWSIACCWGPFPSRIWISSFIPRGEP